MIGEDAKVLEDGSVVGTINYVKNYTDFDKSNAVNQSGNYFPIELGEDYNSKEITVTNDEGTIKKAMDTQWVLRIPSATRTFEFKDGEDVIIKLNFARAKLLFQD